MWVKGFFSYLYFFSYWIIISLFKLNGINTQGENIADNGGVKESYIAYQRWVEKHGPEPKLPGLDYTPQQMFWIASGQTWCAKYRKGKGKNA